MVIVDRRPAATDTAGAVLADAGPFGATPRATRVEALVWRAVTACAFAAVIGLMFVHPVGAGPTAAVAAAQAD